MKGSEMIKIFIEAVVFLFLLAFRCNVSNPTISARNNLSTQKEIKLPEPVYKSDVSIEEALVKRRSVRSYENEPLELKDISQLLWASQGITSEQTGGRTAPSAGAKYPLEVYVVSGNVNSLAPGVYHYQPLGHTIQQIVQGDVGSALSGAAHMQGALTRCAAVIVIAAEYKRTTRKYSEKGIRFVDMEAGHAAQNICLQAVSLNIGTVTMGAFKDSAVKQIVNLPPTEEPLYLMPVGKKKD
jgi:SagB-type dehydrogenase family enzyme